MRKIYTLVITWFSFLICFSQAPQSWTSSDMYLALRKLNVLGSVLYVAAHPDDENTRLITYFSKDKLYRTGYLSITRGDGGQNLIGDEQGIDLGLIRTQELLAARRIDGGEQFFTRAFDFGYSKNPDETFRKWDKEKILGDVVWVIRTFQPDVIITRFPTTGEGGHGHHTGSSILANEAFAAAADPNRFPEQLQTVEPWQVKRILWNTFNFGGTNTITEDQFKVDVGGYNPLLGKSYGEIAAESRSQHKSQGFGVPASRGESFESFKTTKGPAPVNDLMEDVNLSWNRVAGGAEIEKKINKLIDSFDLVHPKNSVAGLVQLYKQMNGLRDSYWKAQKLKEVKTLIEQCSGLFVDVTVPVQFAVQTDSLKINFSLNNRLGVDASLERIKVDEFDSSFAQQLIKNKNLNFSRTFFVPASKTVTQPYWLEEEMEEGYYHVENPLQIGKPDAEPAYIASIGINIYGESFVFSKPVKYKFTDPVRGEIYEPVVVVPPVTVKPSIQYAIIHDKKTAAVNLNIKAYKNISFPDPALTSALPPAGMQSAGHGSFSKNQELSVPAIISRQGKSSRVKFYLGDAARPYFKNKHEVKYDHIPYINYFTDATVNFLELDLKTFNKKIGYIVGAGDKVPEALEQMDYEVTLLTDKELSRNNLQQFDAIISGVRAYNTNDWLNKYYDKLMKYVKEGGNYIVQYNTNNFISNIKNNIGPYDFSIARTRITDENSPVVFLKPAHPVLNFPNKITQEDFKGWVQERSIYHAEKWHKNFESIFSMSDPGEKSDDGGLIIARHGKGYFTYTGIVFFRELPAGVPGAHRLLANLIALNKKKAF